MHIFLRKSKSLLAAFFVFFSCFTSIFATQREDRGDKEVTVHSIFDLPHMSHSYYRPLRMRENCVLDVVDFYQYHFSRDHMPFLTNAIYDYASQNFERGTGFPCYAKKSEVKVVGNLVFKKGALWAGNNTGFEKHIKRALEGEYKDDKAAHLVFSKKNGLSSKSGWDDFLGQKRKYLNVGSVFSYYLKDDYCNYFMRVIWKGKKINLIDCIPGQMIVHYDFILGWKFKGYECVQQFLEIYHGRYKGHWTYLDDDGYPTGKILVIGSIEDKYFDMKDKSPEILKRLSLKEESSSDDDEVSYKNEENLKHSSNKTLMKSGTVVKKQGSSKIIQDYLELYVEEHGSIGSVDDIVSSFRETVSQISNKENSLKLFKKTDNVKNIKKDKDQEFMQDIFENFVEESDNETEL